MLRNRILLAAAATALATSCASTSKDVTATLVPTTAYETLACDELDAERRQLNDDIARQSHKIDDRLIAERIKMGVGVTLFWPALLLIADSTDDHEELARLKGARFTVRESMRTRGCALPPPAPAKQA